MATLILETEDHQLLDRVGAMTGRMPGNITRGREPLGKTALLHDHAVIIRARILPTLLKLAEAGPSTHQQFSESFASMAFTFLEERAPTLREFMIGFQVVDKGEEGNNAFGIFGFQLPSRVVQVPVFFVNGEVKGYQLLFVPDQQLFLPLHEGFVQRLVNSEAMRNGMASHRYGDTRNIADPAAMSGQMPRPMKYAEALQKESKFSVRPWAVQTGVYNSVVDWLTNKTAAEQLKAVLGTGTYKSAACDLDYYLTRSPMHLAEAIQLAQQYPAVHTALRADDADRMNKLAETAISNGLMLRKVAAGRNIFGDFTVRNKQSGALVKHANASVSNAQELALSTSITIHTAPPTSRWMDSEKALRISEKVAENGVAFDDKRSLDKLAAAEEVSSADIPVSEDIDNSQPLEPSEVDVICKDRKVKAAYFIPAKNRLDRNRRGSLILSKDGNEFAQVHGQIVFRNTSNTTTIKYESFGQKVGSTLSPDKIYVLMDSNLNTFGPFYVRRVLVDGVYDLGWSDYGVQGSQGSSVSHGDSHTPDTLVLGCECDSMEIAKTALSTDEDFNAWKLMVPKDARILSVATKTEPKDDALFEGPSPRPKPANYMQPLVFDDMDVRDLAKLTVKMSKTASGRYSIADHNLNRRAAMISLVVGFGLTEKSAEAVLANLNDGAIHRYMIKRAAPKPMYMENPSAVFPQLEGPIGHSENSRVPYVIDTPEDAYEQLPNVNGQNIDPSQDGYEDVEEGHPALPGNSGAMGGMPGVPAEAQQAMGSNVQGAMDVTVLASIVSNSRIDGAVSQAASQILRGNSETGQLILLMYAQSAAFEDMYSEANMQALEDTLLNAFDANGDLYLRLKQTNVSSNPATEAAIPESHAVEI